MQNIKYPKLFSPVRIGRLEIKNRVAMTAMGVNLEAASGGVNDDIVAFYEARARGQRRAHRQRGLPGHGWSGRG